MIDGKILEDGKEALGSLTFLPDEGNAVRGFRKF